MEYKDDVVFDENNVAIIPLLFDNYDHLSFDMDRFVTYCFTGNTKDVFCDRIDLCCYVLRGKELKRRTTDRSKYSTVQRRDLIKILNNNTAYCSEDIRISITSFVDGCSIEYYISESYSKKRYKEKSGELRQRFSKHTSLYEKLFDEACLNKKGWMRPQHFRGTDVYTIQALICDESVNGEYVYSGSGSS